MHSASPVAPKFSSRPTQCLPIRKLHLVHHPIGAFHLSHSSCDDCRAGPPYTDSEPYSEPKLISRDPKLAVATRINTSVRRASSPPPIHNLIALHSALQLPPQSRRLRRRGRLRFTLTVTLPYSLLPICLLPSSPVPLCSLSLLTAHYPPPAPAVSQPPTIPSNLLSSHSPAPSACPPHPPPPSNP